MSVKIFYNLNLFLTDEIAFFLSCFLITIQRDFPKRLRFVTLKVFSRVAWKISRSIYFRKFKEKSGV